MGIFEIFVIDDEARKLIYEKVPSSVPPRPCAVRWECGPCAKTASARFAPGWTTPDKVIRATVGDVD